MGQGIRFSSSAPHFPRGLPASYTQVLGSGCHTPSDQDIPHHFLSATCVVTGAQQSHPCTMLRKLVAGWIRDFDPDSQ